MSNPTVTRRRRVSSLLKRTAVLVPLVVVCATVPGFITNGVRSSGVEANPSSIIERVEAQRPPAAERPAAQRPGATDTSVSELVKAVKAASSTYDSPVSAKEIASVRTVPGPYRTLGRIVIPDIGLDTAYGEGVFAKTLDRGPGHWPGTPMPGRTGNAVISGHRNTHTQPFKELDELRRGDEIVLREGDQAAVTFTVTTTTIVEEAKYRDFVLRQPRDGQAREVTLFACHPEGNPDFRIVVRAVA